MANAGFQYLLFDIKGEFTYALKIFFYNIIAAKQSTHSVL